MKRHCFFVVSFVLLILSTIISCDATPENLEKVAANYATPTIKGTITIPEGSDVAPEDVYIKVIDNQDKTVAIKKANADKSFVIQNLNAEMKYKLLFTSEEPEFTNRSVTRGKKNGVGGWLNDVVPAIKEGNDVGSVKMKPLGTIKGRAFIDGETEHYDITVYIPGTSYSAITDKDGNFSIYSVPEGTYTLRYVLDNHLPIMVSDVMLVCPENVENPEKTVGDVKLLSNKGTVQGKAYLGDSTDSTGITIKLESEDKTRSYDSSTSQDGNYVINNVEPGRYRIIASYSTYLSQMTGYFDVLSATITTAPEQISLFEDVGVLTGSASLSEQSIKEGIQILIKTIDGTNSYTLLTDSNGSFTKTLKPGSYTVTAIYPGYTSQSVETMVVKDSTSNVVIPSLTLSSGVVTGLVKLEGGSEYSGVTVTLIDPTDSKSTLTAVSGVDGSFSIQGITKSGTYLLSYTKDGYVSSLSNSVEIQVGKVTTVETVTLASIMSRVKGKVELEGTTNYESVTILIKNDKTQYQTTSNNKGEYTINGVLPGTYTLLASKDGYVTATTGEFVVESSSEKRVETLSLSIATRSIIGKVELEMLSDYSGVLVTATNVEDTKKVYSAITNSSGTYTLAGLVPGAYSLVISYTGYRTETISNVNVVSSSVTTIPLKKMTINRGTISGVVSLEGKSNSSGINVELLRGSVICESTTTDSSGSYSFYVPQGNYTGVRYSCSDFASSSIAKDIALFADNYFSLGNEVLKATHNSVFGSVDVLTTDDESGVTISFDGISTIERFITASDGLFRFDHIPLGNYTLRLQRQDCSDITIPIEVKASDGIDLSKIEITPNTATIKGKVNLNKAVSLSKVKVSVDMGSGRILETHTDDSGRYEIGGVSIADEYAVSYSKDGWNSQTQKISPKLSILEVRELNEVTLFDTTAPNLTNVVINNGANTTSNKNITLNITASDNGSGLDKIMVTYDNVFDRATRQYDYSPIFNWELPAENGTKTIYVKVVDRAGNESPSFKASVELTNQKTEVSGVLMDDKLTWTKEKSPYLVTGSVMVEKGTTLKIEEGVDVQFAGEFGITVEGKIEAIGTETQKISFYGVDSGKNNWIGINCKNDNRSMLKFVDLKGSLKGLQGHMAVLNSTIETDNYAMFNFSGEICDSTITGGIYVREGSLINNLINLVTAYNSFNLSWVDSFYLKNAIVNSYMSGNSFFNDTLCLGGTGENNKFQNMTIAIATSFKNTTFDSCNLYLVNNVSASYENNGSSSDGCSLFESVFRDCKFGEFNPTIIKDSNFVNCDDVIEIKTKFSQYEELDLTSNFWGYANTKELKENGLKTRHSFINDYYADKEFSITKANLSNYREEPNPDAGYKGDSYYTYPKEVTTKYDIGSTGPAGGTVFYDKGYYSNGWRYLEVAPFDVDTDSIIFGFYKATKNSESKATGTSTIIGSGKLNTKILVKTMEDKAFNKQENGGETTSTYAAMKCFNYTYGGYSDWFLPSKDELNLIYNNIVKNRINDMSSQYWSSSESSYDIAWSQSFDNGTQYRSYRDYYCCVRPIRAF